MSACLFRLEVSHTYFESGRLDGWTLEADPATRRVLQRYGLVPGMRDGEFALTTFQPAPAALLHYLNGQLAGGPLVFWLRCDQEQLVNVTDLPLDWAGQIVLSSKAAQADGDHWRLSPVPGPRTVARDGVAGVLSIYLDDLLSIGSGARFTVELAARPVHWVYYVVNRGQTRLENPAICKNGFFFAGPRPVVAPGGEHAIYFDSGETVFPLQQRPATIFDLVDRRQSMSGESTGDAEICVLKGLPVPDGNQLDVRNGGADPYVFCAMHVYL